MYALCGRGPRSSLRVLRHGLEVNTCLSVVNFVLVDEWKCDAYVMYYELCHAH